MKCLKNIISLVFLAGFVFITPLKTNALTIDEIIKDANGSQPISITNIKNAVIIYDYQEDIEEINSILDESLNSSKNANDKLVELNTLMYSINNQNKALLTIRNKKEYDNSVSILKEKVELAKQINVDAKNYSQSGLDKYNEALVKYASLKSKLEEAKEKADAILDFNISKVNDKLDIINNLLEELANIENKLEEAYDEANITYENAKKNANVVNNNFSEKLEELKEYVEVNGEEELNELIQANANYLTSGVLYATSQVALKLINIEIELIESEITSLKEDLSLLNDQLVPFEEVLKTKENELATLNSELTNLNKSLIDNGTVSEIETQILSEQAVLQDLINTKNNIQSAQNKCSSYIDELNAAILNKETTKVVELLLKNEESYGFTDDNITVTIEQKLNSSFELVNYVFVKTDTSEEFVYSYEEENGLVTIYEQEKVPEHEVTELTGSLTSGKYLAKLNGNTHNITSINITEKDLETILGFGLGFKFDVSFNGFFYKNKYYEVKKENNSWYAVEKKVGFFKLVDGDKYAITVTEAEHYRKVTNSNLISSQAAVNRCNSLNTNSIDSQISLQETVINTLQDKLTNAKSIESQISQKETAINIKENEVDSAKAEIDKQKSTLTSANGMTYVEIETKLAELDEKLNHYPKFGDEGFGEDLSSIATLTSLISNATQGNIDVQEIVKAINDLNVGLNIKKRFISEIDSILAKNYNKVKQDLIDIAGEDLENISNILSEIAPLIGDVVDSNLKLLETKVKYEIAKDNYDSLLKAKELVLETKGKDLAELEELEKIKEENDLDLNELDAKFQKAEKALISKDNTVGVKINEFVIVEDESNELENNTSVEKTDTTLKEESNISTEKTNTTLKEESKTSTEKTDKILKKENNNKDEIVEDIDTMNKEEGFNWLNLLWVLPILLIIFFIIIFIKKKKED